MAFIKNSVGIGGKNDVADVKVIQWMLKRTQTFYSTNIFTTHHSIEENGLMDLPTSGAIRDFINYRIRNSLNYKFQESLKGKQNKADFVSAIPVQAIEVSKNQYIFLPDDRNYQYLLRCSLNPVCEANGQPKSNFSTDPLAISAFRGTISFYNFKNQAEAMDGKPCAEQKYGINIITNTPYVALGFNASELQRIQKGYIDVLNSNCSNTYIRNNLPTPAQVFQNRGVVFLHNSLLDLSIPKEMRDLNFDEENWIAFRKERDSKSRNMDAFTLGIRRSGNWAYSPAITVFKPRAFTEKNYSFEETFAHETIHRSGVGLHFICEICDSVGLGISHDLANYKPYREILENCGCAKGKLK